jgi:methyl-accepting chemotaxis protein
LQKQVDAGQMTKEAAIAEFGKRGNTMTFDKGNGYLFGTRYDGIPCWRRSRSRSARTAWTSSPTAASSSRELMRRRRSQRRNPAALRISQARRGEADPQVLLRGPIPGWTCIVGTGAYLDDLDAKMKPIALVLGLAILGIALLPAASPG